MRRRAISNDLRGGLRATAAAVLLLVGAGADPARADATVTIATVNNGDMVVMQRLSSEFEKQHPDIHLRWVVLEENVLRQRVTTDIATKAGQFDVLTIGNYEVPIWAKQGWLTPMDDLPASYDVNDLLKPVRDGLTYEGKLYGLPFYGESAMTYYRTDLFDKAGIKMPDAPTYEQIRGFADKVTDKSNQIYGMCLRGKPGWGENMAYITSLVNAEGGQWFDTQWKPTIDTPEWHTAIGFYDDILKADGPPGATSNGFNENLALFASGHCGMWIDATVAGGLLYRQEAVLSRRQGRLRCNADRQFQGRADVAVELESCDTGDIETEGCCAHLRHLGDVEGVHPTGRQGERLDIGAAWHTRIHLRQCRLSERRAVRGLRAQSDRGRQPERTDGTSAPLCRRAVRGDSGIPRYRYTGGSDYGGDADRSAKRRSGTQGRAVSDRAFDAPGRLSQEVADRHVGRLGT